MPVNLRTLLETLHEADELIHITKPVDIRHIATLVDKSEKALLFHHVIGYEMPVVSGLTNSRNRIALAMGCAYSECEALVRRALDEPLEPVSVDNGAEREVFQAGEEVDLFTLPVPLFSV